MIISHTHVLYDFFQALRFKKAHVTHPEVLLDLLLCLILYHWFGSWIYSTCSTTVLVNGWLVVSLLGYWLNGSTIGLVNSLMVVLLVQLINSWMVVLLVQLIVGWWYYWFS